jgi:hypothetical protein
MEGVGAYGGGKAGGAFDPISFAQRPQVILRAVCWLFSIVVFGCISSQGWFVNKKSGKEECLYNGDGNACNYGVGISVIAFLASMGFLAGEYLFEQMSSVKTRKHYVLGDLSFSGESQQNPVQKGAPLLSLTQIKINIGIGRVIWCFLVCVVGSSNPDLTA